MRDRSTHFGGQFEHETHFCEICAKTAERRPEGPSRFCLQGTQQVRDDPNCICNIITSDETWVYGFDPETKQQQSWWRSPNSPRPRKARQVRSIVKSMLIVFSRHPRHCPQGIRTPWSNRQWRVLLRGFEAAEEVHSAQTSRQVEEKQLVSPQWQRARSHITRCSTVPDFQKHYSDSPPPYSPDLAHCDFFLFPKTKLRLKGRRFDTTEEIHAETQEVIDTHLRTFRDALNHGKHVGIAVCMPKGTTSKETVETRSYLKKLFLWSNSHNVWVAPRVLRV